jgi:hypothetical protein
MRSLLGSACSALLPFTVALQLSAQTPPATPNPAPAPSPADNRAPAEIVPPGAPSTPAPGRKTIETTTPSPPTLSPGSRQAPQSGGSASHNDVVDALSEAEVEQALAAIKERYVGRASLSDLELKRATLHGLLTRLNGGVALASPEAAAAAEASPFRSEIIDGRIGYARLGTLSAAHVSELDAALKTFAEKALAAVVLDLRATPASSDFELAAEVSRRFAPKGKVLFTLKQPAAKDQIFTSKDDPRIRGVLVVLTQADTAGSAEIIAATLRAHAAAMIIGQKTKGQTAEFTEVPLGDGRRLRVAVAEATLSEGGSLLAEGVKPDLPVDVSAEITAAVLQHGLEKGAGSLVVESDRPRMNEAALVAGTNPEIDAMQAAQRTRGEKPKLAPRDAVLQRAIDFVTAIAIYEKGARGKK